jgi:hypothetical protein
MACHELREAGITEGRGLEKESKVCDLAMSNLRSLVLITAGLSIKQLVI